MKVSKNCPDWAQELTKQVCKDYRRKTPHLVWYRKSDRHRKVMKQYEDGSRGFRIEHYAIPASPYSNGFTNIWGKVFVRAGTDPKDQGLVLLHELAHHLLMKTRKGRREHHSIRFWRLAFELYQKYGVDLEYAHEREKGYRQKSVQAYQELSAKK